MSIQTPTNQIRLTNVVVVRLKRAGRRFELACYPNKVISWREGFERDLDEVLQLPQVFTAVSKGEVAQQRHLQDAFGDIVKQKQRERESHGDSRDYNGDSGSRPQRGHAARDSAVSEKDLQQELVDVAIRTILAKGELQVSDKERAAVAEQVRRDIATVVSEKCIDAETGRPMTVARIEQAMADIHYSVRTHQSAKKQALIVIKRLAAHMSIRRAAMRIRVVVPNRLRARVRNGLKELALRPESEVISDDAQSFTGVYLIDPSAYRAVDERVTVDSRGKALLEVLDTAVADAAIAIID